MKKEAVPWDGFFFSLIYGQNHFADIFLVQNFLRGFGCGDGYGLMDKGPRKDLGFL